MQYVKHVAFGCLFALSIAVSPSTAYGQKVLKLAGFSTWTFAPIDGGSHELRRFSVGASSVSLVAGRPLVYGVGANRIAVIDVVEDAAGRHDRMTVVATASGATLLQSTLPNLNVMRTLGGVARRIVFRDNDRFACFVTYEIDATLRTATNQFVTCIDTTTGILTSTVLPKVIRNPVLTAVSDTEIAVGQLGLDVVTLLTYPGEVFKTIVPPGFADLRALGVQPAGISSSRYLNVQGTGLLWISDSGTALRVANAAMNPVGASVESMGGKLVDPQQTVHANNPAIVAGKLDAASGDISSVVMFDPNTFAAVWSKPILFRARHFAASSDGKELALIDTDTGLLKRYLVASDTFVNVAPVVSSSLENALIIHTTAMAKQTGTTNIE